MSDKPYIYTYQWVVSDQKRRGYPCLVRRNARRRDLASGKGFYVLSEGMHTAACVPIAAGLPP